MNERDNRLRSSDETPIASPPEPVLATPPEFAVAEDVHSVVSGEIIAGSSLWRDARRRLLRNKLAVFGMAVVIVITLASLAGPAIIKRSTGFAYDVIPKDIRLNKS